MSSVTRAGFTAVNTSFVGTTTILSNGVGEKVGVAEGKLEGICDGIGLGIYEGRGDGAGDGFCVGADDGDSDGYGEGREVGN